MNALNFMINTLKKERELHLHGLSVVIVLLSLTRFNDYTRKCEIMKETKLRETTVKANLKRLIELGFVETKQFKCNTSSGYASKYKLSSKGIQAINSIIKAGKEQ